MLSFKDRIWGRRIRRWIKPIQSGLGKNVELRVSKDEAFVKSADGFEYVFVPEFKFAIPNSLLKGGFSIDAKRLEYLRGKILENAVAVDAGAGVGDYSMHLSKICKEVHAFEPMERSFMRLRKNIERNGIKNVFVNKLALLDKSGQFGLTDLNVDYNRIVPLNSPKTHEAVDAVRLDEYMAARNVKKIDLIVADIQGAEFAMVRGLGKLMDARPLLLLEVNEEHARLNGYRAQEFFDYLSKLGYSRKKEFENDTYCFACE